MAQEWNDDARTREVCPQCGSPLKPGAVFCTACGSSVERREAPRPVSDPQPRRTEPVKGRGGSGAVIAAVVCGVLLIAAAAVVLFILKPWDSEPATISPYPAQLELAVGESGLVQAVISPEKYQSQTPIWVTSNAAVATVEGGLVRAVGPGTCTVTVALSSEAGASADISVTVTSSSAVAAAPAGVPAGYGVDTAWASVTAAQVFPNRYLTAAEAAAMDYGTLQFYINTIYAKNGYIFSIASIAAYFQAQPWYIPISGDAGAASARFSAMDKANMDLLVKYRAGKTSTTDSTGVVGTLWTYSMVDGRLSESFVAGLSDYDIQLLINTIYAKGGYIFQMQDIQELFESQYWYFGRTRDAGSVSLSQTDTANLALLAKYR